MSDDAQKWEGIVNYRRMQCSRSEASIYEMPFNENGSMYGMPVPFDLEDGAVLRVTIEVVKPGRFKLNSWRVMGDCEKGPAEFWHRKIKSGTRKEGFVRHEIEDGRCSWCGMSEKFVRIREAHYRLTGEAPPFVDHDPYLEPEAS